MTRHPRLLLSLTATFLGCGPRHPPEPPTPAAFHRADDPLYVRPAYRIDPPDELEIHAPAIPELDGGRLTVREDGTVAAAPLGDVTARDRTAADVARDLRERAARLDLDDRGLSVTVIPHSKFAAVFARGGGKLALSGRETVASVLSADDWAMLGTGRVLVVLLRPPSARVMIDPNRLQSGDRAQDFVLEEGDILVVQGDGGSRFVARPRSRSASGNN